MEVLTCCSIKGWAGEKSSSEKKVCCHAQLMLVTNRVTRSLDYFTGELVLTFFFFLVGVVTRSSARA
jgi:hypothetical protein